MNAIQSPMPSAVFVGFADHNEEITKELRRGLDEILAINERWPKPESTMPVPSGLLLCFNFPTRTLEFVRRLGARARADDWPLPPLRIGVHIASGVPKAGASDSSRTDSSVDGAIRVARWATPNQAVATPAFHSNAMELLKKGAQHFKNLGRVTAKDGKSLAVFEIIPFSNHNKPRTGKRS